MNKVYTKYFYGFVVCLCMMSFQNCSEADNSSQKLGIETSDLKDEDKVHVASVVEAQKNCTERSYMVEVNFNNESSKEDLLQILKELANPSLSVELHGVIGYYTNQMLVLSFSDKDSETITLHNLFRISGVKIYCNQLASTLSTN